MVSFPQASPPTPFAHLYPPPYALHALPISFVSILPPAQYWVRSTDHSARRPDTHSLKYHIRHSHWSKVWIEVGMAQFLNLYKRGCFSPFVYSSIAVKMQGMHVTFPIRPSLTTTFKSGSTATSVIVVLLHEILKRTSVIPIPKTLWP